MDYSLGPPFYTVESRLRATGALVAIKERTGHCSHVCERVRKRVHQKVELVQNIVRLRIIVASTNWSSSGCINACRMRVHAASA